MCRIAQILFNNCETNNKTLAGATRQILNKQQLNCNKTNNKTLAGATQQILNKQQSNCNNAGAVFSTWSVPRSYKRDEGKS
jgi:hypothetical protein